MRLRIRKKRFKSGLIIGSLLLVGLSVFGNSRAMAIENGDMVIQVSPTKKNLDLKPGEEYVGEFLLQNAGAKEFRYDISPVPYWPQDEQYTPNYGHGNNYTQIVDWTEITEEQGELKAGEALKVHFKIKVPQNAPAGSQYMTLMARTGSGEGMLGQMGQVGIIIGAKIDGETYESGKILKNEIPSFKIGQPISAVALVENDGNVGFDMSTKIEVKNILTGQEVYSNDGVLEKQTVLPDTKRAVNLVWRNTPQLGLFRVRQTIGILGNEPETRENVVVVMPLWLMILGGVFVFLGVMLLVIKILKNRTRKNN